VTIKAERRVDRENSAWPTLSLSNVHHTPAIARWQLATRGAGRVHGSGSSTYLGWPLAGSHSRAPAEDDREARARRAPECQTKTGKEEAAGGLGRIRRNVPPPLMWMTALPAGTTRRAAMMDVPRFARSGEHQRSRYQHTTRTANAMFEGLRPSIIPRTIVVRNVEASARGFEQQRRCDG